MVVPSPPPIQPPTSHTDPPLLASTLDPPFSKENPRFKRIAAAFAISNNNRFGPIVDINPAATGNIGAIASTAHPLANLVY